MSAEEDGLAPGFPGDQEDYQHMLEDYSHYAPPAEGEVLQGTVVGLTTKHALVDIGFKSEGMVPIHEFTAPDGTITVRSGDTVEVMVDRAASQAEGYLVLSHTRAARLKIWDTLEDAYRRNLLVSGRVLEKTKGGLSVDVGVVAFMPGSQVDSRPFHNLDSLIGGDVPVKILKLNRRRGNVVVSRKAALEEETSGRKADTLSHIEEGSVITGVVKNLTDYGVFIYLGGIDGLLHVSDISYGRIGHPSEALSVGDEVTVKVLKLDRDKERVSLGMKQVAPDPWSLVPERYQPGSRVIGRVVSVTDYGAFIELEPGVEGLIHISEMTWSRRMKHPGKVCKIGDQVEAVVLEVKTDQHRVSLGIKQLEADPWTTVAERYAAGSLVEGRVRKLTEFGAFVEIEEGIDGLVHISDLTWTKRLKHPSEAVKKGQIIQAVVLNIDPGNRRLSLGVKQLQPDSWETFFHSHSPGDLVRGRVTRAAKFGLFVELAPEVEGLCHNSEIPPGPDRTKDVPLLPIGAELDFKIVKMVESEKKIGLSLKAISEEEERTRLEDYHRQAAAATVTMEQAMKRNPKG